MERAVVEPDKNSAEHNPNTSVLLAAYSEICKSYHAIDDFRTKLLGMLPLSSLVGIVLLGNDKLIMGAYDQPNMMLGFAAVFAAMLTLALFAYEIRGIRRSHQLIVEGLHLEQQLGILHGQFHICSEHQCDDEDDRKGLSKFFNSKLVACIIYSVVFTAWVFIGLKWGTCLPLFQCAICALIAGLIHGVSVFLLIRKYLAA